MPPASRNQREPTAGAMPTATAASSLLAPAAISTQNRCLCSRDQRFARPGDRIGGLPVAFAPQYTSTAFRAACQRLKVTQSASRTGSCLDNAVAESFFATLKVELVHRLHFATRADARRAIFAWVHRYNHRRRHSTIGMIPPAAYEQQHRHTWPLPSTVAA
jgi:transposase InsO family protein